MNQGRIWTVVSPSVGLPLFLGGVAVTAVVVHFAILSTRRGSAAIGKARHAKVSDVSRPRSPAAPMPFTVHHRLTSLVFAGERPRALSKALFAGDARTRSTFEPTAN